MPFLQDSPREKESSYLINNSSTHHFFLDNRFFSFHDYDEPPLLQFCYVSSPSSPHRLSCLRRCCLTIMNGHLDIQFLSVNHNKYVPYPPENQKNHKQMAPNADKSHPRTPKHLHAFDLLSISDQLPPNTGPPGTVPVNGTNSSSTSNKNLSHVPCKFYRQGICQAGNLCPFSHNLDGTLAADKLPCKYFQKGNCKFGLKCALAHFLPDGTRVNSKSLLSYRRNNDRNSDRNNDRSTDRGNDRGNDRERTDRDRQDRDRQDRDRERSSYFSGLPSSNHHQRSSSVSSTVAAGAPFSYSTGGHASTSSSSESYSHSPVSQPIDISVNSLLRSGNGSSALGNTSATSATFPSSMSSSHPHAQTSVPSSFRTYSNNYIALGAGSSLTSYGGSDWLVNGLIGGTNGGLSTTSHLMLNPFNTPGTRMTSNPMRRSLSSNSPPNFSMASPVSGEFSREFNRPTSSEFSTGTSAFQSPQTQFSTPYSKLSRNNIFSTSPQYNFNLSGPDSAVVDDDSEGNYGDEDNVFFEDYVPASLGNLILTPQECKRRNSRSQSGTLLVRPNIASTISFDKRSEKKLPSGDDVFLMD